MRSVVAITLWAWLGVAAALGVGVGACQETDAVVASD